MGMAVLHELLIYAASHPLPLLLAEGVRLLGDVVRVPGLGYIVNDPYVANPFCPKISASRRMTAEGQE